MSKSIVVSGEEITPASMRVDARYGENGTPQLTATDYKAIFNLSPDMICVADRQGLLLDVNPACTHILGYSPEEMIGKSWRTFAHPDDIQSTQQQVAAQLNGNSVINFVNRYRTKAGGYCTLQWQASFTGSAILVGTARDISEQVRHAELQASLAQNERKRICFALHDGIGQQLFGLKMLASRLRRALQRSREDLVTDARNMESVAQEALGAVRGIMDGLIPFEDRSNGFADALTRLADRMQELYGVQISLRIADSACSLHHDLAVQIFLVAQEFVINAIKHAVPGRIDITLGRVKNHLSLVVINDGRRLSIPAGTTGLGLEIIHHRAALLGATFTIAAGKTEGAVARFDLALVE